MPKLKDRFVTVQLTLLSITVALILEGLLGSLMEAPGWSFIVSVQAADVAASALAMWLGFAYGISVVDKIPHVMDFLAPFGLLMTLSLATRFIGQEPMTVFLICVAGGSFVAATTLWMDCQLAQRANMSGPRSQAILLTSIGLWELALAAASASGRISVTVVAALLLASTIAQVFGIAHSIRWWRAGLRQAAPASDTDENDYQS
jgi:hypothetical protein